MSYSVEHVRFTLECDVCGLVEKRDLDSDRDKAGTAGWGAMVLLGASYFACPACIEQVKAILQKRDRVAVAARKAQVAACEHDYQQHGFSLRCTKCLEFKHLTPPRS